VATGSPWSWSPSPRSISACAPISIPTAGPARLIYAFEAVIIGGLGSLWGTLAGGIIIGVAQTVGAAINPEWQILSGHIAFLARPPVQAARPVPARRRLRARP
jgi:hypothetical protein